MALWERSMLLGLGFIGLNTLLCWSSKKPSCSRDVEYGGNHGCFSV